MRVRVRLRARVHDESRSMHRHVKAEKSSRSKATENGENVGILVRIRGGHGGRMLEKVVCRTLRRIEV